MADREYQDYSDAELFELKRELERARNQAERDREAYVKQFEGSGSDWVWTSEDYNLYSQVIQNQSDALYKVEDEFANRRKEREARRRQRES